MRLAQNLTPEVKQTFNRPESFKNEPVEAPWFNILTAPISKQRYIICYACGSRSFNPRDIEQRYCSTCRIYHD